MKVGSCQNEWKIDEKSFTYRKNANKSRGS